MPAQAERERKALALTGMAENFGKPLSAELMRMWLKLLDTYAAELVENAVMRVMLEYEYKTLPPFAVLKKELDKIAGHVSEEEKRKLTARAEWSGLLENLRSRGSWHGQPEDMHPVTAYVVRMMGGWDRACRWDESALAFREKDFIRLWLEAGENADFLGLPAIEALPRGMGAAREALGPCLAALSAGGAHGEG